MRRARKAGAHVAVAVTLASPVAFAEDEWFGRDKALHFGASLGIAAGSYGVSTTFLDERWQRATFGGGVAIGVGAAKEGIDAMGAGTPSWKDFTWDVAGAAVGVGIALAIDLALGGDDPATKTGSSPARLTVRF